MFSIPGTSTQSHRAVLWIGWTMMLIWGVFAIRYATERLYGDSAYYLFQLINEKEYVIEHKRPASIMMQVLPLILVKLHAPIGLVIGAFSLNEWLWYLAGFLLLAYRLKTPGMALAMVYTLVFGVRWNFYNPVSELLLATPFLFILLAILQKEYWRWKHWVVLLLLVPVISFSHPLFSFILPACLLLAGILSFPTRWKRLSICLLYVLAVMAIRYHFLDDYEKGMVKDEQLTFTDHLKILDEFYFKKFFLEFSSLFAGTIVLVLLMMPHIRKRPVFIGASLLLLGGYFLLLIWQFGEYYTSRYEMFERYLFPLTLITCFAFFSIASLSRKYVPIVLLTLGLYQYVLIYINGIDVVAHYRHLERCIRYAWQFNEDKINFRGDNYHTVHYGKDWFMGSESILLSARRGPEYTKQIYLLEAPGIDMVRQLVTDQYFYAPWWPASIKGLNKIYFQIGDAPMRFANTDSVQSISDTLLKKLTVDLAVPESIKAGSRLLVPVTIVNQSGIPLYSGLQKGLKGWSYRWLDAGGKSMEVEEKVSPLLADLYSTIEQDIVVNVPAQPGDYTLQFCIRQGDERYDIHSAQRKVVVH